MAEDQFERTEAATPRQRRKYREKGQVAKSREIGTLAILGATVLYFYFAGPGIYEASSELMRRCFALAPHFKMDADIIVTLMKINSDLLITLIAPMLVLAFVLSILSSVAQTGWLFTTEPLKPDPNRVNPFSRFQQLFLSTRFLSETGINILKIVLLTVVLWVLISDKVEELPDLMYLTPYDISATLCRAILEITFKTLIFFMIVAIIDYLYQWFTMEKQMRMTKQEIRDEFKETEGDPHQKNYIRSRMRDISLNKMIQSVPGADVVVTNPTHLAVALRYEQGKDRAPRVVAKGRGFWAERIKAIARENGVQVVEEKLLARALFKSVKVGGEIPADLYRAVAELLAHVYSLQRRAGKRPTSRRPAPAAR